MIKPPNVVSSSVTTPTIFLTKEVTPPFLDVEWGSERKRYLMINSCHE
jgi:hypothetical protein